MEPDETELTPDQQLASEIRAAATALYNAMWAATTAGLVVRARVDRHNGDALTTPMIDITVHRPL